MTGITQYVVSIIGIVFLGVLVDVIMPDGEMNKFIKGMFSLLAMFGKRYPPKPTIFAV